AIVIRQPAPGLASDKCPTAQKRIEIPPPELEGIPAEVDTIGTPAIAEAIHCIPTTERVKVAEPGCVIVDAGIALRRHKGGLARLDAPRYPLVEVVQISRVFKRNGQRI